MDSKYDDPAAVRATVAAGRHRGLVGGLWEEVGRLQLDFLRRAGLLPHHYLLDVGCGSLRGGIRFVPYLDPGHYFGIDINDSLIEAGYAQEVEPAGLAARLPRANLACVADFDASGFGRRFDMALAQSVFSHLGFNRIRLCLERLAPAIVPGGTFFATCFALPEGRPTGEPFTHPPAGVTTYGDRDPFHYRFEDFRFAARGLPWQVEVIGDWGHPRGQQMLAFRRT